MSETAVSGGCVVETCRDEETWNSFIERNDGPIYARWGWGEAIATYGIDRYHLIAREEESEAIVGAVPLYHIDSWLFQSQLLSPAFAERGSITFAPDAPDGAQTNLLDETKRLAGKLGVDNLELRGSTVPADDDFITKNRYVTFEADVACETDEVWAAIKDSRQRQIMQAADDPELEFRLGSSLDALREYYELYLKSMRGHGSPPHSFEFFRTLWEYLYPIGNLRLGMVFYDGSLINGMIDLASGSTVYQWGVVNEYEHRDKNGGSWLIWKTLQWAAENGYTSYEFGRTREGSGVYMFKKSFNGSKVWYDDLHYFPAGETSLPDPEDDTYDQAKKIWRMLPLPVVRYVGPRIRKQIGL
jgi:hypothetical protein